MLRLRLGIVGIVVLAFGAIAGACGSEDGDPAVACTGGACLEGGPEGSLSEGAAADSSVDAATGDGASFDALNDGADADADGGVACSGEAGTLDETFGDGGVVYLKYGGSGAYAVAVQPDGKVVVGGNVGQKAAVVRLLANGSLDSTFGTAGLVELTPGDISPTINAISLQPDGKILAAGTVAFTTRPYDFVLLRLQIDGALDGTFGTGGVVLTDFGGRDDYARSVALRPDGKIVVGGSSENNAVFSTSDFALARYESNGTLDATFGAAGRVLVDMRGTGDSPGRIALQSDGKVVVAGGSRETTALSGRADVAAARIRLDGTLDTTFGIGGRFLSSFGGPVTQRAASVVVDSAGGITLAGNYGPDVALYRLSSVGALDSTFGIGGVVTSDFAGGTDTAEALMIQADGKLVATGTSTGATTSAVLSARYGPSGVLDTTFGAGGSTVLVPEAATEQDANASALGACSVIVVGSWAYDVGTMTKSAMGIARFHR